MSLVRLSAVLVCSAMLALYAIATASADATYHTARIALEPVGGAPGSGFVINAHANGPQIAAHENYSLQGVEPNATYQVTLQLYPFDTTCSSTAVTVPSETLTTNGVGNGHADHTFVPADIPPALHNATHGIVWQVSLGGSVVYESGCEAVTLD